MSLQKELKNKAWSDQEVSQAVDIMHDPDKLEKHKQYKVQFSRLLYWMSLLVLTVCNFLIAVVLIPFVLMLNATQVYFAVGLLALVFGLLFNLLIRDIEHLEPKHNFFAILFIPIISVINLYIMITVSGKLSAIMKLPVKYSESIVPVSLVYVGVFILPFIFGFIQEHWYGDNLDKN